MRFSSLTALVALATAAIAAPTNTERHVLHERRSPSENWVKRDRVHSEVKLPMRIGLTQNNLHMGNDMLLEV